MTGEALTWAPVLAGGQALLASPEAWALILAGVVLGMVVGVLPGFGPPAAMALLFPLIYVMPPLPGMAMLAGIFYGAKYGGAVSSILLGIPGEADAVATLLEGYPLARAGRASQALRLAMLASFTGSMAALAGMVLLAPFLTSLALALGSGGRALLMLMALALVCGVGQGDTRKNLVMALVGLSMALIGFDPIHGVQRLNFGMWSLAGGIDLGALLLGFFGLGDILSRLLAPTTQTASPSAALPPPLLPGKSLAAALRGALIGFGVGLVPSGAGVTASFASYSLEKKLSPTPQHFGQGQWTGLAGPESANNAAAIASFAPLLLLGLPTNPVMAAMLGAMTVAGVTPGPNLPMAQPVMYWGFIISLALGNIFLLLLGLGLAAWWARLALMPFRLLWPVILILCLAGSWMGAGSIAGPVQCILFGALSVWLRRHGFSPSPLVLALVLGSTLEANLIQFLMG